LFEQRRNWQAPSGQQFRCKALVILKLARSGASINEHFPRDRVDLPYLANSGLQISEHLTSSVAGPLRGRDHFHGNIRRAMGRYFTRFEIGPLSQQYACIRPEPVLPAKGEFDILMGAAG